MLPPRAPGTRRRPSYNRDVIATRLNGPAPSWGMRAPSPRRVRGAVRGGMTMSSSTQRAGRIHGGGGQLVLAACSANSPSNSISQAFATPAHSPRAASTWSPGPSPPRPSPPTWVRSMSTPGATCFLPGPELRASAGDLLRITLDNQLPAPPRSTGTSIQIRNAADGVQAHPGRRRGAPSSCTSSWPRSRHLASSTPTRACSSTAATVRAAHHR